MRGLLHIIVALVLCAVYSYGKERTTPVADKCKNVIDTSQFYRVDNITYLEIYDAHRKVKVGDKVTLKDLDDLFGEPFVVNIRKQTSNDWRLYEQEVSVGQFLPKQPGDTLVMMRRVYGRERDWIVWINLEVQNSDSLRVLNFLAYDNSNVDI